MRTSSPDRIKQLSDPGWWGERTLDTLFGEAVSRRPDQVALIDPFNRGDIDGAEPSRLTFSEVANAAENLAETFYSEGLRKDDIVVVQLPNVVELVVLYLALGRLGVIVSPVPVQYGPFELAKARETLEPAAFITVVQCREANFADEHGKVFGDSCRVFSFGANAPEHATPVSLSTEASAVEGDYSAYVDEIDASANDILTICWTSGTTGTPKGVPRSHNMWISSAICANDAAELCDHEILLNPFPMVNMAAIGGFLYCWLMRASTLVLHHPFDMGVFLKQIQDEKVGYTIAPPAVLTMLLKKSEILDSMDIGSLRCIGSGSAPLSEFMVGGFKERYGIEILNIFGSNEGLCLASGPAEVADPSERAQYFPRFGVEGFDWANRVAGQIKSRLRDLKSGEEVSKPGQQGELEFWGPPVFDGYLDSPEANAEVFTDDGYFRSGDLFEIVEANGALPFYKFVGRCKDIIVRGGVNISPDEIDRVLEAHPKLAEACVIGYEDDVMGERVGAVVVAKPGEDVTLEDLTGFLREQGLAVFKLPEAYIAIDELPKNATGKVVRREAKALFDAAQTR